MTITSPAFLNGDNIPDKYTCDGINVNPPLIINDVPNGTKSLALIVDDPDAPMGVWTHWMVWNINPNTKEIAENSIPKGAVEGVTSFGKSDYGGPCPSAGTHRYFFKLYALDSELALNSLIKVTDLTKAIENHILAKAELMGRYQRK